MAHDQKLHDHDRGLSPTFLGHRLWEETRVALFKQVVDDRDAAGRPAGALAAMLERYLEDQEVGDPVHTWPVEAPG